MEFYEGAFEDLSSVSPLKPEFKNLAAEYSTNIRDHFPFPESRHGQDVAMNAIEKWNKGDKKFFILEGPTGFGKAGISCAEASLAKTMEYEGFSKGAHILSPQKVLTAQYLTDFAPMGMVELKGRSNYPCPTYPGNFGEDGTNCEVGGFNNNLKDTRCPDCPYERAKKRYISNPLGVCNFAYYLNETEHVGNLPNRNVLVLDEVHNTEQSILSLVDIEISRERCSEYAVIGGLPRFDDGDLIAVKNWLMLNFTPAANEFVGKMKEKVEAGKGGDKAIRKLNETIKHLAKVEKFAHAENTEDWMSWYDYGNLMIKPLTAALFANDMLFSKAAKVLMLSATILDFKTFCRNLGIPLNQVTTLAMDSDFPLENRPIYYKPIGSMNYNQIDETLPKLAKFLSNVLHKYSDKKGVVHTNSYKVNQYLVDALSNAGFGDRIVTHETSGDRDWAVQEHLASTQPTVLFSPSLTEGIDLKEDLSRFQIICKVPYPPLNPYVKARMNRDSAWYTWVSALRLIQASGRSVRSRTDKAVTIITDSEFANFASRASNILPRWWLDSIIW
jgi:ATP-dependent DNA helicase DinG